jgi:hypothetical protein
MTEDKRARNPEEKRRGEMPEGKFDYDPVGMSGKKAEGEEACDLPDPEAAEAQRPGENPPGKYHYDPVGMAGKKAGVCAADEEKNDDAKKGE